MLFEKELTSSPLASTENHKQKNLKIPQPKMPLFVSDTKNQNIFWRLDLIISFWKVWLLPLLLQLCSRISLSISTGWVSSVSRVKLCCLNILVPYSVVFSPYTKLPLDFSRVGFKGAVSLWTVSDIFLAKADFTVSKPWQNPCFRAFYQEYDYFTHTNCKLSLENKQIFH